MKRILLFLGFFLSQHFFSQLDNTHYLQPLIFGNYSTATITEEYVYLSTPSASNITVTVKLADEITIPRLSVYDITAGTTTTVTNGALTLSNSKPLRLSILNTSNTVIAPGSTPLTVATNLAGTVIPANTGGLIFRSSANFFVNYRGQSGSQAGSVLTKGNVALGKTFFWGGTPNEFTTNIAEVGNMVSIMASQDNTTVTISNIDSGTEFINGSNATPITGTIVNRTLNKGESFVLYAKVKTGALSLQDTGWLGAKITADKNVAVTVGGLMQQGSTDVAGATNTDYRDFAVDQLVPVEQIGNEYVVMQGNGGNYERVVVIATEANTTVSINGSSTPNYTLANIGDYVVIPGTNFISKNMYIKTNKASYVFHKIFGSSALNTNSFMFIPPLSCFGQKEVNMVPDAKQIGATIYPNTELAVLAASGASTVPTVTVNGTSIAATTSTAVSGNTNWTSYRYDVANTGGASNIKNVKITSAGTIQAELLGANSAAGFGGYYSGFGTSPIVNINVNTSYLRPCTSDTGSSVLSVGSGLGNYQWYKNGTAITNATNNSYAIPSADTNPAEYNVIISVPGGCTLYSNVIKTYECPCYKPGATGTPLQTGIGISTRAEKSSANWPSDVNNGFVALESNDKGLVITRMPNPETAITSPVDGMLVFDTDDVCLKIYNGTKWSCINQTCN